MRFTMLLTTIAVLLIADQVRSGGHYRREVLFAIERSVPALVGCWGVFIEVASNPSALPQSPTRLSL